MQRSALIPKAISLLTFAMVAGFSMSSWAIDLQPGDATAPPSGLRAAFSSLI